MAGAGTRGGDRIAAPRRPHCSPTANAARILWNYTFAEGRFYAATNDCGVILRRDPDTVRGPDVGVYDDAASFADLHPKYGETVPLLAAEVVSPSGRMTQVVRKATDYITAGVKIVCVIVPEDRAGMVFRAGRTPLTFGPGEEITGEEVLPGFCCLVGDFFRLPGEMQPA